MKDEIFGPILPIISFQNIEDAIAIINKNEKPLAIYYFGTAGGTNFSKVEKGTSSGALVANDTVFQLFNPDLPFGGVGYSGNGRYHGYEGFKAFSNGKSILTKPSLNFYPYSKIYPPFTEDKQSLIRFILKYFNLTQKQLWKRLLWFIFFLWLVKLYLNGTISMKTYNKWKNIYNMAMQFMPMLKKMK
jgi:aldehyde dehydrogenase (NAD+)